MLLAALVLLALSASAAAGTGGGSCGGIAPVVFACSTGEVRMPYRLSVDLDPHFTGGLASVLVHPGGERVFRCEFLLGEATQCTGTGTLPAAGAQVTHECRTFFYQSPAPGGVGGWSCSVEPA